MFIASLFSDLGGLAQGLLSFPPACLVIALVVAGLVVVFASPSSDRAVRRSHESPLAVVERHAPEQRTLGIVALGIIIVFIAEFVLRGYVFPNSETISWWRFVVPIAGAVLGLAVALCVIATRGSTRSRAAAAFSARRGWATFSTRTDLSILMIVTLVLGGTTVLGGIASSANDRGQFAWLEIPIPNEPDVDPIRVLFYGWAYGIPVLVGLAALAPLVWAMLERNAARPFLHTDTAASERSARRVTAALTARIATASLLLALAEAWDFIAGAASGAQLTVVDADGGESTYESAWQYAELAIAAGWIAPALEVAAFALLLLAAYHGVRRRAVSRTSTFENAAMNEKAVA